VPIGGAVEPAASTEVILLGGERHRVEGSPKEVEQTILSADRGSILEFAWFVESATGDRIGINPSAVAMLRAPAAQ
jgi:hypothetical protein